ncbi:MAG: FecR domain-containing protein, partial [Bacteroidota bacterium]
MRKTKYLSLVGLFLFILLTNDIFAQPKMSTVVYALALDCGTPKDPRNPMEDVAASVFIDSKQIGSTGGMFAEGGHYLRVNVATKEGYSSNFIITKIEWFKCAAGVYGEPKNEVSQQFNSKEATMIVNIETSDKKPCYRAVIYVSKCGNETKAAEAKIKIITTAQRKRIPEQNPTDKIKVSIGDVPVSFDKDGVGFIKIKPGKYQLKYDWSGGNISEPGPASIKMTKDNHKVELKTQSNQFGYDHQVELDLPNEFSGTENLYDFEISLNMIYEPRGGNNEVRIVALMPEVQVHKAGTPEDNWVAAYKDMVLQEGDEISCDPDGSATLQFADNSTTVVKNTTQLKIASYFTEGGVVKTEILLKMGEVAAKVHKSEATKSDFVIKAPGDGGSVRGTIFSYKYDPNLRSSFVKVEEGSVEVRSLSNAYAPVLINAGQQVTTYPSSIGRPESFTGKIDFTIPVKEKTNPVIPVTDLTNNVTGNWQITRGSYTGVLKLKQDGSNLSGEVEWNNHQKGKLESGTFLYGFIIFVVVYDGDLRGNYNAHLDETGMKMTDGKGLSNKGTESTWSANRQN